MESATHEEYLPDSDQVVPTQKPPQRRCPHCLKQFSYSNYASHAKRCKVRQGQDIEFTHSELARLREENSALRRERDDWALRYKEVAALNAQLLVRIPGPPPAVVRMD